MAETPHSNDAFFREVDDAVRQDRLAGFGKRFGLPIGGAILIGLAGFGGWLYWSHHSKQVSAEVAEKADAALEAASTGGNPDPATMKELADASQPGYRALAALTEAAMAAKKGDVKTAAKLYGDVSANSDFAQPYRDLGLLRQVALTFDQLQPQQVVDRLKPLAVEGEPWFGSAAEMTAIAYMKMGKKNLAGPLFAAIARDAQVPDSLRSRARQMSGLLGVDAVDTETAPNAQKENADASTGE